VLSLEIGSPELDLTNPLSYARWDLPILAKYTEKFHRELAEFEAFEAEEFNDMALLEFHRSYIF
jgi:hypothetical protein